MLVIDDSIDTARTMVFLLRDSGFDADYSINGYSALTVADRFKPDVIFLDIGLPDFDGVQLARQLRAIPGLEKTRIIAITGRVSDDEKRALQAGCERFLRKPVAPDTLEYIVKDESLSNLRYLR